MDPVTRCLHFGKRMIPAPSYSGRTELKWVFCDKLDPMETPASKEWAESPLAQPISEKGPLKELARSNPSDVMSLYSTSAKNFGSTHVAIGFSMGMVSFVFGLTTVSSFLIWLEIVRDQPVPTLPM